MPFSSRGLCCDRRYRRWRAHVSMARLVIVVVLVFLTWQPAEAQVNPTGDRGPMRLATPQVAAQLRLTEEQRAAVAGLVVERAEALAAAGQDDAQRQQVMQQFDERLLAVLTDEQRQQWNQMEAEPRLTFQFQYQKWTDVLQWFAEQSNLSLVMDAPPEGSFNFTDTRQYTPSEAIDLLNSVLLSKGYTLIRRDRMLILVDLTAGLPEGLIPRVAPDELEQRGRFEFVSVMFPLEGRPAEEVVSEITPLLGPHGDAFALKQTGRVLVTDTAGVVRAIGQIIESIPKPRQRQPEQRPPSPELTVYPLDGLEPDAVLEITNTLLPDAKVVVDRQAGQLNVFARPNEHSAMADILKRMKAGEPVDRRPVLDVYELTSSNPEQLVNDLKNIVPTMRFVIDSATKRLIAWGSPAEHERLKQVIDQLTASSTDPQAEVQVFRLSRISPAPTAALLTSMFPSARVTPDPAAQQIAVLASEEDRQQIAELLKQLDSTEPGPNTSQLRVYDAPAQLNDAVSIVSRLVPTAQVVPQPEANRVVIVATGAEHDVIAQALARLSEAPAVDQRRRLKIYPVTAPQRARFLAVMNSLGSELADLRVVTDASPGELAIWARPDQHTLVEQLLAELSVDRPEAEQFQLRAYPLANVDVTTAQSTLNTLLPEVRLIPEAGRRRLLAWAAPATHEQIRAALEQIDQGGDGTMATLEVYSVPRADLYTVLGALQPLAPQARMAVDMGSRSLLVWGLPEDQQRVATALEQMKQVNGSAARQVKRFELRQVTSSAVLSMLPTIVPRVTASATPDGQSVVVWGDPNDLQTVSELINEIDPQPADGERTLVAYPLEASKLESFMRVADPQLVRAMQLTVDTTHSSLLARGTAEEHARLKASLDQFAEQLQDAQGLTAEVYPLQNGDAYAAYTALISAVPRARLAVDTVGNRLLATASPEDHELIRRLVEQMDDGSQSTTRPVLRSYPVPPENAIGLQTALATIFARERDVSISVDQTTGTLLAMAPPRQHEAIQQFLTESAQDVAGGQARAQVYPLEATDGYEVVATLNTLFAPHGSRVRVSFDRGSNQLVVVAPPEQQAIVRDFLAQIPRQRRELEVIALRRVDAETASDAIDRLFSDLSFRQRPNVEADAASQQLFVRATPEQLAEIRDLLAQMGESPSQAAGRGGAGLRVVPFPGDTRAAAEQLRRLWPRLRANELRVLQPGSIQPPGNPSPSGAAPTNRITPPRPAPVDDEPAAPLPPDACTPEERAASDEVDPEASVSDTARTELLLVSTEVPPTPAAQETPPPVEDAKKDASQGTDENAEPAEEPAVPGTSASDAQPSSPAEARTPPEASATAIEPPVILVPGDGEITIASDDPEAVEQAAKLLEALAGLDGQSNDIARIGNNLFVYPLKYTSAELAADSIQNLMRGIMIAGRGGRGSRGAFHGPVVAVADRRLNAVVVFAHRSDHEALVDLLHVLDSPESPEALVALKPKLIPVKYAKVERVEAVIRSMYRTQMQPGGGRQPIPIPSGIPTDLALMLQQANAAITGPLLTISSDPVSNCLIVLAPPNLIQEISELVAELDQADRNDPSRSLRLLEIESVNSDTVQEALDTLLDRGGSSRSRFRGRPRR